ncbi:unnamed protein product [Ixodes persulcatus]
MHHGVTARRTRRVYNFIDTTKIEGSSPYSETVAELTSRNPTLPKTELEREEAMAEEGQLDYDAVVYQCGACDEQFSSLEEIERHHSGDGAAICPYMVAAAIQPQFITGDDSEVVVMSEDVAFPGGGLPAGADEVALSEEVDDPEPAFPVAVHGHACPLCGRQFSSKFLLDAHAQSHHATETKVYSCELCRQKFYDSNEYVTHLVSSHAKKDHCCTICNKWYTSRSNLKTHMMIHAGRKPHQCDICGRQFTVSSNLKAHRRIHTGERKYICQVCKKGFITSTHLKTHMAVHTGEKPYQCEVCFREFAVNSNMRAHMLTHTGEKRHECQVCGKQFATSSHVKTHLLSHTGQRDHKCPTCGKGFTVPSNLKAHMKIHSGQRDHACDLCSKRFYTNSDLRSHKMIHTGERPYQCEICLERFTKMSNLNSHRTTHTGERPHQCEVCHKRFRKAVNLRTHRRTHAQDQTHPCSLCDQAFPNVTRLRAHNKQCHQESHACEECGRRFQSPLALVAHRRVHSGAAPFGCSLCQRSFSKEAHLHRHLDKHASRKDQCPVCQLLCSSGHQLQIHMRTHTGEKPYACDLCPRRFTKQVNLKRHLQVHTKVKFECSVCLKSYLSEKTLQAHYRNAHLSQAPNDIHVLLKQEPQDFVLEGGSGHFVLKQEPDDVANQHEEDCGTPDASQATRSAQHF